MLNSTLTAKQQVFATEYLIDLNATQAAIRAGYSKKTAESQGSRLLRNVKVKEHLSELGTKRSERCEITSDEVLQEIAKIAFVNLDEEAMVEHRARISVSEKLKALEQLGKHLKLFTDRVEHDGGSLLETLVDMANRDDTGAAEG